MQKQSIPLVKPNVTKCIRFTVTNRRMNKKYGFSSILLYYVEINFFVNMHDACNIINIFISIGYNLS